MSFNRNGRSGKHIQNVKGISYDVKTKKTTMHNVVVFEKGAEGLPVSEQLIKITHAELKALRDEGKLIPGCAYRITDYQCTTTQLDTKSAAHQFDIIVVANDEKTLNENARAIKHEGDTYFENCKLEAWQLKYCLDNDTSRFGWALDANIKAIKVYETEDETYIHVRCPEKDEDGKFAWAYVNNSDESADFEDIVDWSNYDSEDIGFTNTEDIIPGETIFEYNGYSAPVIDLFSRVGKGVIYYMKDEWNNECPYDFKNIQFKRYKVYDITENHILSNLDGKYLGYLGDMPGLDIDGEDIFIWAYTFNALESDEQYFDCSVKCPVNLSGDYADSEELRVRNNLIESYFEKVSVDDSALITKQVLNNITFQMLDLDQDGMTVKENIIRSECHNMSFLVAVGCYIDSYCSEIIAGDCFTNGTFGNNCSTITFSSNCFGNTFGNECHNNTFGDYCCTNTFGNGCSDEIFDNNCNHNTFGNTCNSNTFGNNCGSNTFGNNCNSNTFGNNCGSNTFGNNCYSNTFGNNCGSNTFGNNCGSNTFGNNCDSNTMLDNISHTATDENARWNIFEDGVSYVDLSADGGSGYLQNITIRQGIQGTDSNRITIEEPRGLTHDVTYRKADAEDKTI